MIKTELTPSGMTLYTLVNDNGMEVELIELGATIVSIKIPTKDGKKIDVVLGYDDLNKYKENPCFFGSCVGPIANRTAGATFMIGSNKYTLPVNEGKNNLHTDFNNGLHKRMFSPVIDFIKNQVCFTLKLDDMEYGLPGNREFGVAYSLTDDNTLEIEYTMSTDKKTAINPTNHTYFNLGGHDSGSVLNDEVKIYSDFYTPVSADLIPKEIVPVKGTPFDFTDFKKVGKNISDDDQQLAYGGGYDHNYILAQNKTAVAYVRNADTGIQMEVYTDLPAMQFYTGNNIGTIVGKNNEIYKRNFGLCMETQYVPNSLNDERFDSPILSAGEEFYSKTGYHFIF
ncbi:MAG: galactose mutarotase [Clostridiales bacterium]|nr:galactose mutarotase [Clostridiales bacterium]